MPRDQLWRTILLFSAAAALLLASPLVSRAETIEELQQRIEALNKKTAELETQSAKYKELVQTTRGEAQSLFEQRVSDFFCRVGVVRKAGARRLSCSGLPKPPVNLPPLRYGSG